jgi:hypothetical protein
VWPVYSHSVKRCCGIQYVKMSLKYLTSRLGKQQLLFDRFRYVLERDRNGKRNWRCVKYDSEIRCRGRCISVKDTAWKTADHNHAPSNNEDGTVSIPQQYGANVSSVFSQKHNFGATIQPAPKHFSGSSIPRQPYTSDLSDTDDDSTDDGTPEVPRQSYPCHHGSISSNTDGDDSIDTSGVSEDSVRLWKILEDTARKFVPSRFTGLGKRIWEARRYLVMLITQPPRNHEVILIAAGTETIKSLAAFCNAILDSRIPISADEKSSLMEHRIIIRKIADRTVKLPTKIRLLKSNPLFLFPLMPIIDKFLLKR